MKKLFTLLVFTTLLSTQGKTQFDFGTGIAYFYDYNTVGVQVNTLLGVADKVDLSGSATLVFEDNIPFVFDIDTHYNLLVINDSATISPFAGVNILAVKDNSDIGINLGASLIIPIQDKKIYIETKYVLSGIDGAVISGGLFF